jgi:hypothetical protein
MVFERLRRLKNNYSDEIPDEVLHGEGGYKVRRNWWHGVVGYVDQLKDQGQIPKELQTEVDQFITHYTSPDFHQQDLTTEDDIKRANSLLDKLLGRE